MSVREPLCALAVLGALLMWTSCKTPPGESQLDTPEQRFSYAIGARLGGDLRRSGHAIDRELVLRGVEDGLADSAILSDAEIAAAMKAGVDQQQANREALRAEIALAAERSSREFLAGNREREGVVELPSGLQYEVLREGSGPVPTDEDFVTCHYRGTLIDGTVFDDTAERGKPSTFRVTGVVDGFEEGLLRMPAGSRWKLYVPAELAYGARGYGRTIPPNAALIFEVELLEIGKSPR